MRLFYLLACSSLFLLLSIQPAHAVVHIKPNAKVERSADNETALSKKELKKEQRKAHREYRKQVKKELKARLKQLRQENDTDLLLLVIIAILLPPLAMLLYEEGLTSRFWISLLLTILFYFPGLIYTLIVILGGK